jgi:hypothetical protein
LLKSHGKGWISTPGIKYLTITEIPLVKRRARPKVPESGTLAAQLLHPEVAASFHPARQTTRCPLQASYRSSLIRLPPHFQLIDSGSNMLLQLKETQLAFIDQENLELAELRRHLEERTGLSVQELGRHSDADHEIQKFKKFKKIYIPIMM